MNSAFASICVHWRLGFFPKNHFASARGWGMLCGMTGPQLAVQFFLQLAIVLAFCQVVGIVAKRLGQPQVVAEMIAGVLLGPSLFGLFWPELFKKLFPADSLNVLFPVAQLGLAAYMFVVGMEFRVDIIGRRVHNAMAVSLAGMLAPFVLGAGPD